jgi:hypothetical protein
MKLPLILFDHTLEWDGNDHYRFRLIAKDTPYGFVGIDYLYEKFNGVDALGTERWIEIEQTELGLFLAAAGQILLKNKLGNDVLELADPETLKIKF